MWLGVSVAVLALAQIAPMAYLNLGILAAAAMMLSLPEENRSAILGFIHSAATGGIALSTVIYGLLGDVFPLYIVFIIGNAISLVPMLYMCFHPSTREFVIEHCN